MSTQRTFDRTHPLGRDDLARLVAADIPPGPYLNLGIRQPTRVADFPRAGQRGDLAHREWDARRGSAGVRRRHRSGFDQCWEDPVTEMPGATTFV